MSSVIVRRFSGIRALILVLASLAPVLLVGVEPVSATGQFTATGDITFTGHAWLPQFPCTGGCGGDFHGSWGGHVSGVHNDATYTVSWKTVAEKVHASFGYLELLCAAPGSGAVAGEATGGVEASASADAAEVVGAWYSANPSELPRLIIGVSLGAGFEWVRVGNSAVIVLRPTWLHLNVAGLGWRTVLWGTQRGTATFAPTHSDAPPTGVVSCDTPLTNVTGEISGNIPLTMPAV